MNAPANIRAALADIDSAFAIAEALKAAGLTIDQLPILASISREIAKLQAPRAQVAAGKRFEILGDVFRDNQTGLEWTTKVERVSDFDNAEELAKNCRAGGHSDWTLPEESELTSLRNIAYFKPATHPELKDITPTEDWYYTRTLYQGDKTCVWIVHFGHGCVSYYNRHGGGLARFVRRPGQ